MSSRQRARLTSATVAKIGSEFAAEDDEDDDSSGDDIVNTITKNAFVISDSSSDSESGSESESGDKPNVIINPQKSISKDVETEIPSSKATKGDNDEDIDEILAAFRDELGLKETTVTSSAIKFNRMFEVDAKSLDIDAIMRKRFGGEVFHAGEEEERRNAGPRLNTKTFIRSHRKLMFGTQKPDWVKPPALFGGGFGVVKTSPPIYLLDAFEHDAWFQFKWSDEYFIVDEQFQDVQNSGDANQLVIFLQQYPYHTDGLLQLAMVFARTGQMDRAAELVRRCLFCLESTFSEAFKPAHGCGCRIDPTLHENAVLFSALFRHAQITSMLGCPGLAADVAKILLGLCPNGDPMHVLLALDHYLVASGRWAQLLLFTGASSRLEDWQFGCEARWACPIAVGLSPYSVAMNATQKATETAGSGSSGGGGGGGGAAAINQDGGEISADDSKGESTCSAATLPAESSASTTDAKSAKDIKPEVNAGEVAGGTSVTASLSIAEIKQAGGESPSMAPEADRVSVAAGSFSLQDLPNWWFSLALALFNGQRSAAAAAAAASAVAAAAAAVGDPPAGAADAIPADLPVAMLRSALVQWPFMLSPLMKKAGIEGKSLAWRSVTSHPFFAQASARIPSDSPLLHIAEIFAIRNGGLWNREEVHRWLLLAAEQVLAEETVTSKALKEQQQARYQTLSAAPELRKYRAALPEDFMEEYPRLPPEANPLDPRFADPRALARQVIPMNRQRQQQQQRRGRRGAPRGEDGVDFAGLMGENGQIDQEALFAEMLRLQELGVDVSTEDLIAQIQMLGNGEMRGPLESNVDLDAPLMQLFLQTFLPWSRVGPRRF